MPQPRIQTSITLFGSPPWGFRLSGGKEFNQALVITRITPGSLAAKCGLTAGDVLITVNGQYAGEMTQDECEAKIKQAVGSLYLVVEKNAAKVSQLPSGEMTMEADRSVYTKEKEEQDRVARHNRSAKPFAPFSPSTDVTQPKTTPAPKKAGFRSVAAPTKSSGGSKNGGNSRGQPDGGPPAATPDFIEAPAAESNKHVLGPNAAVGLYSGANVEEAYNAQVRSSDL